MFIVYVLESIKDEGWYIGFTTNIEKRLEYHNHGKNVSTKNRRPFKLIYYEAYTDKRDALGRETFLKSGAGRKFMQRQLSRYLGSRQTSQITKAKPGAQCQADRHVAVLVGRSRKQILGLCRREEVEDGRRERKKSDLP